MKKFLFFLNIILFIGLNAQKDFVSYPVDPGKEMRDHVLDFERMRLIISFEPEKGKVTGRITHHFRCIRERVDSFYLDGPGIIVKSASLNGKDIRYTSDEDGIQFYPSKELKYNESDSLVINYEAFPKKGIYFIGWNDPKNISRKQIWTQGQGVDNRHWFPCYDTPNDKLITEVVVTFDKDYQVLSNGKLVKEKLNKDGTKTWDYKMSHPHASYLVMLGIGKYEIKETKSKSGVALRQWYYPEWKDRYDYAYKYNEKVFNFLEEEIGVPFGWESYSQIPVQDFMFGAMENTSATLFGDFFLVDGRSFNDRNYVSVNAHELAHQWFGDYVTARSYCSHWLQESFATHYNITAERECFGDDHFNWQRRNAFNAAINTKDKKPIAHSQTPTSIIYQKGSVVLQMLKYIVGRDAFNRSVKRYLLDHKYANVDSDDLLEAFEDETGMNLNWFWNEWIYKGGEPAYNVQFNDITREGKRVSQFMVQQVQPQNEVIGLFKMPILFEVHYTDGSSDSKLVTVEKESELIEIANQGSKSVSYVLFDPNSEVLKTVEFKKPIAMLIEQAKNAKNMIDRYDAILAMSVYPVDQKRDALKALFKKSDFHAVRSEIVRQLINDPKSQDLVKLALNDNDVQVRKATVQYTGQINFDLVKDYEKLLTDSSYETIEWVLEKLAYQNPAYINDYLETVSNIEGTKGRSIRIKWLELSYLYQGNKPEVLDQLIDYSSNSYEFITRVNAFNALQRLDMANTKSIANALNACVSNNGRMAGPARSYIKYFYAMPKHKRMIEMTIKESAVTDYEKQVMYKLLD